VWDLSARNATAELQHWLQGLHVAYSQDGNSLMTLWTDGVVRVYEPTLMKLSFAINVGGIPDAVGITANADRLALVQGKIISLWRLERSPETRRVNVNGFDHISSLAFSPDGRIVAIGTGVGRGGILALIE